MEQDFDSQLPRDLAETASRLRAERPSLTGLELDAVQARVHKRAATQRGRATWKGSLMKSRIALTAVLAVGILMSGTGATLAISGIAGSDNAGVAQYEQPDNDTAGTEGGGGESPTGGTLPDTQEAEQVSVQGSDNSLPFTGFLVIPLLVGGVALVGTGAVLRRKAGREDAL